MESAVKSITLYYKQGSSDKIYHASIQPQNDGFIVSYAYGRRGSTLSSGTKTAIPVDGSTATAIFEKLIAEKVAKGYTPGVDGTPYRHTGGEARNTGVQCQLLNPVSDGELEALLNDTNYCIQEKLDGRRLLIWKDGDTITGINRRGLAVTVPEPIAAHARSIHHDFVIDGETVGDCLHAFDLLTLNSTDHRHLSYQYRYFELMDLVSGGQESAIRLVPSTTLTGMKREVLDKLRSEGREGVVFKRYDAPYTAGRPASGGSQFKYKFYETASFIVTAINDKRSVALAVLENGERLPVGNVTIPANQEVPQLGKVIECRYLYAFHGGAIFQPVYLGQREDICPEECVEAQLKYKSEPVKDAL